MNGVRRGVGAMLLALALTAGSAGVVAAAEEGASDMRQIQLLLKKLKDSMASLKDLDDLERAGMDKRDVDRMRRALKRKIQEMIDETVRSIQNL